MGLGEVPSCLRRVGDMSGLKPCTHTGKRGSGTPTQRRTASQSHTSAANLLSARHAP